MSGQFLDEVKEQGALAIQDALEFKEPSKYKVILLNDDYTPMAFVVEVIKHFFHLSEEMAVELMLQVHMQGKAVCGVYTRDIAETKVALVNEYAKKHQHPLLCCMEKE